MYTKIRQKGEGVYDVVGADKGWGDRQMTKGEDREDREIERKR